MKRLIITSLFLAALCATASAQVPMTGAGRGTSSTDGSGGTTWNPADNSDATLSNGNHTAAFQTTASTWHSIRSTNSPAKTAGKWHVEFTLTAVDDTNGLIIGFADSSAGLTNYAGSSLDSIGVQADVNAASLNVYYNGLINQYSLRSNVGDVIALEIDIPNKLMWAKNVTQATGWTDGANGFTGNPGAGVGGTSFSSLTTTGGVMIMGSGDFNGSADTITLNPGPTMAGTISSGFSAWSP